MLLLPCDTRMTIIFVIKAAKWWPLWYEYKLNKKNVPVYGVPIIFNPKR